jgi:hypothetical protein
VQSIVQAKQFRYRRLHKAGSPPFVDHTTFNGDLARFVTLSDRGLSKEHLCPHADCGSRPRVLIGDCIVLSCSNAGAGIEGAGYRGFSRPAETRQPARIVRPSLDLGCSSDGPLQCGDGNPSRKPHRSLFLMF